MTDSARRGRMIVVTAILLLVPLEVGFLVFALSTQGVTPTKAESLAKGKEVALVLALLLPVLAVGMWRVAPWAKFGVVFIQGAIGLVWVWFAVVLFAGWVGLADKVLLGFTVAGLCAVPALLYGMVAYWVAVSRSVQDFREYQRGNLR